LPRRRKNEDPDRPSGLSLTYTEGGGGLGQGHLGGVLHDLEGRLLHAQLELDGEGRPLVVAVRAAPLLLRLGLVAKPDSEE